MLFNFKDAFINKPLFNSEPPPSIIEYLNENVPDNLEYIYNKEKNVYILNLSKEFTLQIEDIDFTTEIDKNLFIKDGKIDFDLVQTYSYNSQSEIKILPDKNNYYTINGKKIATNKLVFNPIKRVNFRNSFISINPYPFPEPFDIPISGNGYELNLKVQRKAINSIDTILFETIDGSVLTISYKLNFKKNILNFSISKEINYNTRVEDIIKANYIINACIDGSATFAKTIPINNLKVKSTDKIPDRTLEFWNKVFEIEKIFNVEFNPDIDISRGNAKELYELYRSIKENKPFKRYKKFNSFKGNFQIKDESIFNKIIGEEISLEFDGANELNIFGQTIKYYSLMILHQAKVTNIYFNENEESIIEVDDSNNGKMFVYQMDFLTKDDLDAFRNREDYVSILEKAEEIDYIEGQI